MSAELSTPSVVAPKSDSGKTREKEPVSMARGMSQEECIAAARMTMWRAPASGGRSR